MLNKTHAEHFVITLAITFTVWLVLLPLLYWLPPIMPAPCVAFLLLVMAGLPVVGAFLGRELAQHSYKLALSREWKWGETMPVKWYEGLTTGWTTDSVLDVLSSLAGYLLLLLIAGYLFFFLM